MRRRTHQQTVDERLFWRAIFAAAGGRVKTTWEIGDRQQLGFAIRQPLRPRRALALRAMAVFDTA